MLKLLVMLVTFLMVGLALLALRQHQLELQAQSIKIYETIRDREHSLLDQRVAVARQTNPWALASALKEKGVNTGDALRARDTSLNRRATQAVPSVETDLVAPLLHDAGAPASPGSSGTSGNGHSNPNRPR